MKRYPDFCDTPSLRAAFDSGFSDARSLVCCNRYASFRARIAYSCGQQSATDATTFLHPKYKRSKLQ